MNILNKDYTIHYPLRPFKQKCSFCLLYIKVKYGNEKLCTSPIEASFGHAYTFYKFREFAKRKYGLGMYYLYQHILPAAIMLISAKIILVYR
ncbi:hypothetical protein CEXT_277261 [Caerostris extrusa]|uniref:Uncharacterized protein n=1 Tax=Caerostris extrusa TaxID=172846 RepID=A0AAV4Y2M6_CAEEX|nr:hypothetical protein CEXT_277261 [Caerostris extrusa]